MKRSRFVLTLISIMLVLSFSLQLTGCMTASAQSLMDGIKPEEVSPSEDMTGGNAALTDFAVRLLRTSTAGGDEVLISPLSVICALAMTMNGAEGETLAEMEGVLGLSKDELNSYLYTYLNRLPKSEKYKISVANSIWFTDDEQFCVNNSFLQSNANYYSAEIYKTPFNRSTLHDINRWVKDETDGMIPKIIESIPEEAVMYLVNALAFEATWESIYKENQVRNGTFTTEDGATENVKMMYDEVYSYLEDGYASGFIRYYKQRRYAFVAMLPNEGVSLAEYISTLDGESLYETLSNPSHETVKTAIPKFDGEYSADLSEILKSLGMTNAFDPDFAEFGGVGTYYVDGNVYISKVLHKTFISVSERGTRAGAATVVEMGGNAAAGPPEEPKVVYLDRPFVYMLIDCETNTPFFIGTTMSVKN